MAHAGRDDDEFVLTEPNVLSPVLNNSIAEQPEVHHRRLVVSKI